MPNSALQRELKKKKQQKQKEEKSSGEGNSAPVETGEAKAAAEPVEAQVRDMIPYLAFYRDVTDEQFQQLVSQLKPWGVPVLVYHMHTMHAWLTLQMLWQMHGRTRQAMHKLFVCIRIF